MNAKREFMELCAVLTVVAALLICTAIAGCATERASPPPAPTGQLCGHNDGTYLLLGCKP